MDHAKAFDGVNITLCKHRSERLWVNVWARIEEGKLTVEGQDLGAVPEEWFGTDEYEYFYNYDLANTEKLLQILSEGGKNPIVEMCLRFSGLKGCEKLRAFCENNGIDYTFYSWV